MSEIVKDFWTGMPLGLYLILVVVIALLIASWIVPPLGAITPSALQGAALILGGTWLFYVTAHIPDFIEKGAKIKASVGNATIEIGRHKKNHRPEDEVQRPEEQYEEETEED